MLDTDYPYYPSHAKDWVAYFGRNATREARLPFGLPPGNTLSPALHHALVRTLQRFHLGESGEGAYLKRFAAQTGHEDYMDAIELFVAEGQCHSRWFGRLLERLGATPLQSHWSDTLFTRVRRAGGLHFELLTFLTAEVLAQRFFGLLARNCPEPVCAAVFAQVVRDESAHIAFHIDTLRLAFASEKGLRRRFWNWRGKAILAGAVAIVCYDQRAIFRELKLSRSEFAACCFEIFDTVAARICESPPQASLSVVQFIPPREGFGEHLSR